MSLDLIDRAGSLISIQIRFRSPDVIYRLLHLYRHSVMSGIRILWISEMQEVDLTDETKKRATVTLRKLGVRPR